MKIAIVHDWFKVNAGAEKVVQQLVELYPDATIFSLVDFFSDKNRKEVLNNKTVQTSFIQNLPWAKKSHQKYLQFFPLAIEQFDLSQYDIIISSSHAVAKGVMTHSEQTHFCYCHSPMRYAWDLYFEYLTNHGLTSGLKSWYAKLVLHYLRNWDVNSCNRVDYFISNSQYIANRIKKSYNREAEVIYPPVNIDYFSLETEKDNYFVTASRLVPYKKIDFIIEVFNSLPNEKLYIIGDGEERKKLESKAHSNIHFLGRVEDEEMKQKLQKAKAFIFAAIEDFGILPVEAMACGTPVIAFGKGGALETVTADLSGLFFSEFTKKSLTETIHYFNTKNENFDPAAIRNSVLKFHQSVFKEKIDNFIKSKV